MDLGLQPVSNRFKKNKYVKSPKFPFKVNISKNTKIKPVGVFVNCNFKEIRKYIEELDLKVIQLHGKEDNKIHYCIVRNIILIKY